MIVFAFFVCFVVATTALAFAKLRPKGASPDRIRAFDRWTWLLAAAAALASALFAWPVDTDSMDSLWRPAAAAFNASSTWAMVLLGATVVRYALFRGQHT